ncbi:MAG: hypothetical protein Q7U75_08110, partial [Desulfobacterales bacterium]|nr:hypothetical protein [Desulfobacterales bacterium]
MTAQRVQEAIVAVGAQDNDWYAADASHYERPICPAGILSFQPGLFPDWERFGTRQAFNSRTEWTFFRPMWQGETLTLGMRISDRWLKRGKEHLTFYMSARDAEGKLVAECRFTETVLAPPEYEPPLICRDSEVSETRATNLAPELGTLSRTYTVEMSKALCGGLVDWHTDVKLAQERGFAQPVLLGAQIVCQACELLTRSYGTGFLEGGQISLNVLKPVM